MWDTKTLEYKVNMITVLLNQKKKLRVPKKRLLTWIQGPAKSSEVSLFIGLD